MTGFWSPNIRKKLFLSQELGSSGGEALRQVACRLPSPRSPAPPPALASSKQLRSAKVSSGVKPSVVLPALPSEISTLSAFSACLVFNSTVPKFKCLLCNILKCFISFLKIF